MSAAADWPATEETKSGAPPPPEPSTSIPANQPDRLAAWLQFPRRVILLLIAFSLASALIGALPGLLPRPAALENLAPEVREQLEQELLSGTGPDEPISFTTGRPVAEMLANLMPNTLFLLGAAIILALIMALPLAFIAVMLHRLEQEAGLPGSFFKGLGRLVIFGLAARPVFALGLFFLYVFAIQLRLLPAAGMFSPTSQGSLTDRLPFLVLPTVTLALLPAMLTAQATARMVTLPQQSTGLRRWWSGLLLALGVLLGQIGGLISAAVLVETIFSWPGVGRLMVTAATNRDYPVLLSVLGAYTGLILGGRLAAELFGWLKRLVLGEWRFESFDFAEPARGAQSEVPYGQDRSATYLGSQWRKTARTVWVIVALALLIVPVSLGLVGLATDPEKALQVDFQSRANPDPTEHPWGVDELGRDLQARVLRSALTTLGTALLASAVAFVPAALFGALTGFLAARRKWWTESLADLLLLPAEVLLFIPLIPGSLVILVLLGPSTWLVVGLTVFVGLLPRAVRVYQTLWLAAPAQRRWLMLGTSGLGGLFLGTLFAAICLVATLEFLGFGTPPPQPSLGGVLSEGVNRMVAEPGSVQAAAIILWACAFPCYLAADALVGFFGSKEALVRLNE